MGVVGFVGSSDAGPFFICDVMIFISAMSKPVKTMAKITNVICTEEALSCETAAIVGIIS